MQLIFLSPSYTSLGSWDTTRNLLQFDVAGCWHLIDRSQLLSIFCLLILSFVNKIAFRKHYFEYYLAYLGFVHTFVMDYLKYSSADKQMAPKKMSPFKNPGLAFVWRHDGQTPRFFHSPIGTLGPRPKFITPSWPVEQSLRCLLFQH